MDIKGNVNYVKQELSGDEKVLESILKVETLYKKYKKIIWALGIAIILFFAGTAIHDAWKSSKLASANEAFLALQKNPADKEALQTLKSKNPKLFELYSYREAFRKKDSKKLSELSASKDELVSDISKYTASVLSSKSSDSVYYKEMSMIEDAYLALQKGKRKEARAILESIDPKSPVSKVAELLKHYTIKGK